MLEKMLKVSRPTINRWKKKGIIPQPYKIGNVNLWPAEEFNNWWKKLKDNQN